MSYQEFALSLSVILVVLYSALVAIAFRRSRNASRVERVSVHARHVEGPAAGIILIVSLALFVSAARLGAADYSTVFMHIGAFMRGGLIVLGLYLLGWYWSVRETWR